MNVNEWKKNGKKSFYNKKNVEAKRNGRLWNDHNGNENPRKTDIIANVPCANIKR